MTQRGSIVKKEHVMWKVAFRGIGMGIILTFLGAAAISWLMITGHIKEDAIGYSAMGILIISAIAGVGPVVQKITTGKIWITISIAAGYFLVLAILNMLLFRGIYDGLAVTGVTILGGAFAGLFLFGKPKRQQKHRNRKGRHG